MAQKHEICCGTEIQKLARLTYILEKNTFKTKGFSSSQAHILLELLENDGQSMKEMSKNMGVDCSTMTRNIEKMVKLEYIERCNCPVDKRVRKIKLTKLGRKKSLEIKEEFTSHFGKLVCNIPKEKFKTIFDGINMLIDVLEKENI